MTLSYSNLTTINITERSGNDDVTILEPLFDKLIKKALTNMLYLLYVHNEKFFVCSVVAAS